MERTNTTCRNHVTFVFRVENTLCREHIMQRCVDKSNATHKSMERTHVERTHYVQNALRLLSCLFSLSDSEYRLFYRALLQKRPIIWSKPPHSHRSLDAWAMGWLRSNYRSLLQKSPIKETIFCKRTESQISCHRYEVATISRLLQITGLFCKRAL